MLDRWYFNKRLIIAVTLVMGMVAAWFVYQNANNLKSKFSHSRRKTPVLPSPKNRYSFMAFLNIHHPNSSQNCGGTLIGKRHILTAAHCLYEAQTVWILLGTKHIGENEKSAVKKESDNFYLHEDYNPSTFDNDIGLIYLDEDVELNDNIGIISLIPQNSSKKLSYVVLGWGDPIEGLNDELLVKNVSVLNNKWCSLMVDDYKSKICAIGRENGPCHGDSGGPLLLGEIQIGIVSWGDNECNTSFPTIYTDVAFYSKWIKDRLIV